MKKNLMFFLAIAMAFFAVGQKVELGMNVGHTHSNLVKLELTKDLSSLITVWEDNTIKIYDPETMFLNRNIYTSNYNDVIISSDRTFVLYSLKNRIVKFDLRTGLKTDLFKCGRRDNFNFRLIDGFSKLIIEKSDFNGENLELFLIDVKIIKTLKKKNFKGQLVDIKDSYIIGDNWFVFYNKYFNSGESISYRYSCGLINNDQSTEVNTIFEKKLNDEIGHYNFYKESKNKYYALNKVSGKRFYLEDLVGWTQSNDFPDKALTALTNYRNFNRYGSVYGSDNLSFEIDSNYIIIDPEKKELSLTLEKVKRSSLINIGEGHYYQRFESNGNKDSVKIFSPNLNELFKVKSLHSRLFWRSGRLYMFKIFKKELFEIDTQNGEIKKRFPSNETPINFVYVSDDQELHLEGKDEGRVVWDLKKGITNRRYSLKQSFDSLSVLSVRPEDAWIVNEEVTGVYKNEKHLVAELKTDSVIGVFDVAKDSLLYQVEKIAGEEEMFDAAAYIEQGRKILLLKSYDDNKPAMLYFIDGPTGRELDSVQTSIISVDFVTSSPNGMHLMIGGVEGVQKFEIQGDKLNKGRYKKNWNPRFNGFEDYVMSPDNRFLITTNFHDEDLIFWDADKGFKKHFTIQTNLFGDNNSVGVPHFSPDGKHVLFNIEGINYNKVILYDIEKGKKIRTHRRQAMLDEDYKLFSPNGKYYFTSREDREMDEKLTIWETETGKKLKECKNSLISFDDDAFSHDNKLLMLWYEKDEKEDPSMPEVIEVWDIEKNVQLFLIDTVSTTNVKFSKDNEFLFLDDWTETHVHSATTGKYLYSLTGSNVFINEANPKHIYSVNGDGSINYFSKATGELLVTAYCLNSDPSQWAFVTPEGFFDASESAMEKMFWNYGNEIIAFDQLKARYWQPGLWEKIMDGKPVSPKTRGIGQIKLQPEINLKKIENDQLPIELKKRSGGYGKVSIFINGIEVASDARGESFDTSLDSQLVSFNIKDHPYLKDGENEIVVKASSSDGFITSKGMRVKYHYKKPEVKVPNFYGVFVGINEYANAAINLKYTVKDAKATSAAVELAAGKLFGKDKTHIYKITGDSLKADKATIKSVFSQVSKKASTEDIVMVYLSGHGITWGGEQGDFYFLTTDATSSNKSAYNDKVIRENHTVSTEEWTAYLQEIPALKRVMIIDACGSGKAVDNLVESREIDVSQMKAIDRLRDRNGLYIISGCAADAVSYEASQYGQGLLTYSLLQAMKGAALKENRFVDINTIFNHAKQTVPELASGIGGVQSPQILMPKGGGDLVIGDLDAETREKIPLAQPKTVFVRSGFTDKRRKRDVLGIGSLLDQKIMQESISSSNTKFVFFDAYEFSGACQISGDYTQKDKMIIAEINIWCGKDDDFHTIEAEDANDLVNQIIDQVKKK